jgi:spermidine synthase
MKTWYDETWRDSSRFGLRVRGVLFSGQSRYQRVEILDTEGWGRVLALDGAFMASEADEFFYHEMLAHPVLTTARSIRSVLVIGGGDGGTVREVLRHPEVERCLLVELDAMVVEACRTHLPLGTSWDDPRLTIRFADGAEFLERTDETFDALLVDGSDPEGPAARLFEPAFFAACRRRLAEGGALGIQSESPFLMPEVFAQIRRNAAACFERVHPFFGPAPLYAAGPWSYLHCSRSIDPTAIDARRAAHLERTARYWSAAVHRGALAVPPYARGGGV